MGNEMYSIFFNMMYSVLIILALTIISNIFALYILIKNYRINKAKVIKIEQKGNEKEGKDSDFYI